MRSFQILGLDVLIDEKLHVWLVELNANPSLNVYTDTTLPNGDIEQNLSELDKYIKTNLLSDCLKIITLSLEQEKEPQEMGSLSKILPSEEDELEDLYIYCYLESLFEFLSGSKHYDFLTITQFQRIQKIPGFEFSKLVKGEYELVYQNVVMRSENNQMDLNCFFEGIEELANRMFGS